LRVLRTRDRIVRSNTWFIQSLLAVATTRQSRRRRRGVGERSRSVGPRQSTRRDFCRPEAGATPYPRCAL